LINKFQVPENCLEGDLPVHRQAVVVRLSHFISNWAYIITQNNTVSLRMGP